MIRSIASRRALTFVGHNIAGFDLPWLWRLAVKYRSPLAHVLPSDRWAKNVDDTMLMWAATDWRGNHSLADIVAFLDLEPLYGHGSDVAAQFRSGKHEDAERHCLIDVERTREIHQRMLGRK